MDGVGVPVHWRNRRAALEPGPRNSDADIALRTGFGGEMPFSLRFCLTRNADPVSFALRSRVLLLNSPQASIGAPARRRTSLRAPSTSGMRKALPSGTTRRSTGATSKSNSPPLVEAKEEPEILRQLARIRSPGASLQQIADHRPRCRTLADVPLAPFCKRIVNKM